MSFSRRLFNITCVETDQVSVQTHIEKAVGHGLLAADYSKLNVKN